MPRTVAAYDVTTMFIDFDVTVGKVPHVDDKKVATESILKSVEIDRETVSLG